MLKNVGRGAEARRGSSMDPYTDALLSIVYFVFGLIALYALIKTATVAIIDAKRTVNERKKNNG